jgi:hypothetical protein
LKRRDRNRRKPGHGKSQTFEELLKMAERERWVLEGTYYADTGEAPATSAVFGSLKEAAKYSELLHSTPSGIQMIRKSWQGLTNSDLDVFVDDADVALTELRREASKKS